jgi:hypothetical protein
MKLIYLEWQDAHTQAGWHDKGQIKDFCDNHEFIIKECGWLVEETKRHIVIGTALKEGTEYWDEQTLNLHKIPKTWIKKRRIINVI